MGRAAHAATICLAALAVFEAALAAGAPLGDAAWGGSAAHLTTGQRVASAATAAFWIAAIAVVRGRAAGRTGRRYRWGTLGLVALLVVSALLNVASESAWENYLLAPVALVLAGLCGVVACKAGSAADEPDSRRTARDARPLVN
jgi:MFS-type transporter involved in bile tolerance (Atg22 family)